MLPLTTQKKALVQQTVAYFLTGIVHGPIQIIPASVRCWSARSAKRLLLWPCFAPSQVGCGA